jgi:hypothetical protein
MITYSDGWALQEPQKIAEPYNTDTEENVLHFLARYLFKKLIFFLSAFFYRTEETTPDQAIHLLGMGMYF